MFWIILAAMVFSGGIVWAIKERDEFYAFIGVLITFLVGFVGLVICTLVGQCFITSDEVCNKSETNICAFADNTGTFFVGRYHSDSSMFYSYIIETNDGGKTVGSIHANDAILYDNEKEQPYIVEIKKRSSNPVMRFFFFTDKTKYEIHIPPKSIRYDYNVDLE